MIGCLLERGLEHALSSDPVATVLSEMVMDGDTPAFCEPIKPIGPVYPEDVAWRLARERGWTVKAEPAGYRRVVPSPEPRDIVHLEPIRRLSDAGTVVICTGEGGTATGSQLRHLTFAPGSMGPKVEAACRFVEATKGTAAIGSVDDAARILRREAGTTVVQV